ncbi:MAG: diacylglycerol kinase family protein [Acidobacteriota bacterium]|nr:diacylglycerol kinase family protein [Acidobacteriota bacterium]
MNVCLFWNPHAGEGLSMDEVTAMIGDAGHSVARVIRHPSELQLTSHASVDAVVAAGGDGTVAIAARALAGGQVPLCVLALGTANNIADSLNLRGQPRQVIAAWAGQQVVRIDAGIIQDAAGETPFFESVGAGLVATAIGRANTAVDPNADVATQLQQARDMYVELIDDLEPRRHEINIDGTLIAGDYLLVEVLNMPSVGPNIRLTPEVNPADGLLSLVVATEADRPGLRAYLQSRATGEPCDAGLKSWRGTRITIAGLARYHVDDELRTANDRAVTIGVKRDYLPVVA